MRLRVAAAMLLTVLLLCALTASLVMLITVPFLFDAPGTESQPATWVMAAALFSAPAMCLAAIAGVWVAAFPAGRSRWWYAALGLPLLSALAFCIAGSFRPGFF
ncbi:MAG: hypothetical protein ACO3PN_09665 [Chthoniobacterales bacterium]